MTRHLTVENALAAVVYVTAAMVVTYCYLWVILRVHAALVGAS